MELLRFYAETYVLLVKILNTLERNLDRSSETPLTGAVLNEARSALRLSIQHCGEIDLKVAERHAIELSEWMSKTGQLAAADVRALHENVTRELATRYFVGVDPRRIDTYVSPRSGWEEVLGCFPSAGDDVEEMNKCFALCRYPAAVMHSLLVVEHGLVALGSRVGATDPKAGWDASCRQLERVVNDGRSKNTTGLDFAFLEQLNACAQSMKHAWRNKINHATGKPQLMSGGFAPDVAEEIITATRGFMRQLATGLS